MTDANGYSMKETTAMGEGNHSEMNTKKSAPWATIIGGTVLAIAAGVIGFQVFRAEPAAAPTDQAGKVSLSNTSTSPALARVNGQLIQYDAVARECFDRLGKSVLENLINRTIIHQEVERRGLTVTEAEIDAEVQKIAKRFNLPVDTWYQMLQTERDLTPVQYRRDVIWPMIALRKLAGDEVQVTDSDLHRAFQRDYGPRVRCRMIMMENVRRANEVWEKATRTPEDFDKLAREFSVEANSRALGGAIPPISRYSSADNQSLEDAAFRLQPGEISGLIQVGNRYVILKCEGRTEQVVTDIKDVENDLRAQLQEEKTQERVAVVFDDLKKQTRVDNYLTNTSTGGSNTAQNTSYTNQIQQTGSTLPGADAQAVQPASGTTLTK
ncbi:peptidylprolyl isomerase [Rubinisphaera sp.]|uniref:peptidylprolyl isomerase n=1 Tax=Rubinisphaera sp. TaxID=2024857 RepID=UPI000C0FB158|nr:peptidylprolyl isomerase [Rubinisphaera sp.]MBV11534.1 peptidylprolyl isomerase [Rubinisphaera sp.]|tara:strand:+ start:10343 stop:11488 length:1146 start_codon:yes stop_codon:yes gene_type:complete